jgi:hypothetical protein
LAELLIYSFDIDKLTPPALELLKAAVIYAYKQRRTKLQTMRIDKLCSLAGLAGISLEKFTNVLMEASKAVAVVEAVDTDSPQREDLPYASWPVFNKVGISDSYVTFEVEHGTLNEKMIATLLRLKVSSQATRVRRLRPYPPPKQGSSEP